MTLRESLGGDVRRIHELVDALLDREDGILALFDGARVVSFATLSAHSRRAEQVGENMKGIKAVFAVIASTGMAAVLLTVFFDWRARLLSQIRGERHEH